MKLSAQIVAMIDRDLLSFIPTEMFLAADTDQCHMYSHRCVDSWPQSHMSPIFHVIALPPASWRKILTRHAVQYTVDVHEVYLLTL